MVAAVSIQRTASVRSSLVRNLSCKSDSAEVSDICIICINDRKKTSGSVLKFSIMNNSYRKPLSASLQTNVVSILDAHVLLFLDIRMVQLSFFHRRLLDIFYSLFVLMMLSVFYKKCT